MLTEKLEAALQPLFDAPDSALSRYDVIKAISPLVSPYLRNRFEVRCVSSAEQMAQGNLVLDVFDKADGKLVGFDTLEDVFLNPMTENGRLK